MEWVEGEWEERFFEEPFLEDLEEELLDFAEELFPEPDFDPLEELPDEECFLRNTAFFWASVISAFTVRTPAIPQTSRIARSFRTVTGRNTRNRLPAAAS